jgi:ubiquinone/menaquinone biosynthesis C-methylase UbiE
MSSAAHTQSAPSPEIIFETFNGYQRTAALRAAIELDLFTAIGEGAVTLPAIATRIQASEKGARVLCDFLTIVGLLTKRGDEYGLTQDSAFFLSRHSPACLASMSQFLGIPELTQRFHDLAEIVRKGGTLQGEGTVEPNNPIWVTFAHSMAPLMVQPARMIAELVGASSGVSWKVLDIAASHGLFGIEIAKQNPNAHIVAVDWEAVLAVAADNAQRAGLSSRYSTKPGSAFEVDLGTGFDVVLITNFLHHFNAATNESFLRKVHAALAPGGRAVTLEFVPNDDRVSPPAAASFSMLMLAGTTGGDAYTYAELESMFRNAGFSRSELRSIPPSPESVVVSYK